MVDESVVMMRRLRLVTYFSEEYSEWCGFDDPTCFIDKMKTFVDKLNDEEVEDYLYNNGTYNHDHWFERVNGPR